MLVSSQISGHALEFSSRALTRSHGWDAWLPWQELPSADSPTMAPPGTTQSPSLPAPYNRGVPSLATPPQRSRGRLAPGPLPWVPAPNALPTWPMAPRAPQHAGHPCPLRYPSPHWTLGRLERCPGYPLSDTHRSQPRSQPVNRAPAPLQTGFEPTSPPTTKRPPFFSS